MSINIVEHQRDIFAKARTVRIAGLEWVDVAQEINLHVLIVQHKYDPAKSSPRTFVSRIATNKIRDLLRRAGSKKRSLFEVVSLDELIESGFDIAEEQYE